MNGVLAMLGMLLAGGVLAGLIAADIMLGMLLAGGVLAGLIAADIRRYQNRERAAINWCSTPERQRDEHEDGGP